VIVHVGCASKKQQVGARENDDCQSLIWTSHRSNTLLIIKATKRTDGAEFAERAKHPWPNFKLRRGFIGVDQCCGLRACAVIHRLLCHYDVANPEDKLGIGPVQSSSGGCVVTTQ
jgi:hypothetical protein